MSQPENHPKRGRGHAAAIRRALRAEGFIPRQQLPTEDPTPLEEQVQIIGQLSAKLEMLGISKKGMGALRACGFRAKKAKLEQADAQLLESRDVDETLSRIEQAIRSARRLDRSQPPLTPDEIQADRTHLERLEQQDEKRKAFMEERKAP